jgi:hypothetical protein
MRAELIIIDDIGLLPVAADTAEVLYRAGPCPSLGSSTGHGWAVLLAASRQKLLSIDSATNRMEVRSRPIRGTVRDIGASCLDLSLGNGRPESGRRYPCVF